MKKSRHICMLTACLASLVGAGSAQAHGLWIEQTGATKTLFFGEPENALKEVFPGRLEAIKSPQAMTINAAGEPSKSTLARTAIGFVSVESAASQTLLASETSIEVKDYTANGLGIVKPMYYARFAPMPFVTARPESALDLVPAAADANAVMVSYNGQPLAKAKVTVIAPNTWTQEHTSDAQGRISINTPWRGQYVLEVTHTDNAPGEFEGKRYAALRSRAMLTFVQAQGEVVQQITPPKKPRMP
jgi:hypothetical protein